MHKAGERQFVVGGDGRRSGLAISRHRTFELRILVLPKVWIRHGDHGPEIGLQQPLGDSLTLVVREGTVFTLAYHADGSGSDLDKCLDHVVRKAANRHPRSHVHGQDNNVDDDMQRTRPPPLLSEVAQSAPWESDFTLSLDVHGTDNARVTIDAMPDASGNYVISAIPGRFVFETYWNGFQSLWQLSLEMKAQRQLLLQDLDRMSAEAIASLDLQLLLHIAFANTVSALLRHARPGYVRVTKKIPFVRGRMNPVSAAVVLAGGVTSVECTYDEFGLDTPLHQVIATALDEVCDSHQGDAWLSQEGGPIADAGWLRRQFQMVKSLPRAAAIRLGICLQSRLSKLDGDWKSALDLACLVLEARGLSPIPGPRSTALSWGKCKDSAFIFDISTESCWENLVRKYFGIKKRPAGLESWEQLGNTKAPDGLNADKRLLFDAKYKDVGTTPETADQHQAFVYSYLYDSTFVLLVYPAQSETSETPPEPISLYKRHESGAYHANKSYLASLCLAFPNLDDLKDRFSWEKFLGARRDLTGRL